MRLEARIKSPDYQPQDNCSVAVSVTLPDDTILLPGHNYGGRESTIGAEKRENPFLQMGLGEFLRAMGGGRIILP